MKVTENIKEKLVHYVKTHDEQKTARLISWILVGAMSIAFLGILSCAVIRPKADNNVTRNTGAGGTTIQREYPNPEDYGYDPVTTLIDENGKAYVWIGEDTYARPDTYDTYINDPIWRRHFVNDHATGFKTVFKWDCPTCLENILFEQNIITNTETECTYKGINMAMKKRYNDIMMTYGTTTNDPPLVDGLYLNYGTQTNLLGVPAEEVGFLTEAQAKQTAQMFVNLGTAIDMDFICIVACPTNSTNTSTRVYGVFKKHSITYTTRYGTDETGEYIEMVTGGRQFYLFSIENNTCNFITAVTLSYGKSYLATVTNNSTGATNWRMLYYNPNVDNAIKKYEGATTGTDPVVKTEYDPLSESKLAGSSKIKLTTTPSAYPVVSDTTNNYNYAKWNAVRAKANYAVIANNVQGGTYEDGYAAGQSAITQNPNDYNLYTATQYNAMRTTGRNDVINSPHTYDLYTAAEYTAHGRAEYLRGYANAAGTPSSQDWKISTVVKAVPEGMYTFYQNIVEPIQDPTEELLGVNVGALVAVVAVIGLVVIGIAIVKKVF